MSPHGFYNIFHLKYRYIVELKGNECINVTIQIFSCGWVEIKLIIYGTGAVTQWLRAVAALPETLGSIPITH